MNKERNTYCIDSHRNKARPLLLNAPNLSSEGEDCTYLGTSVVKTRLSYAVNFMTM